MIFSYDNLNVPKPIVCKIQHGSETLLFELNGLIKNDRRFRLSDPLQWKLVNRFLETKGTAFQDELFEIYRDINIICTKIVPSDVIIMQFRDKILQLHRLLNLDEITNFVREEGITAPSKFVERFDKKLEKDNVGTEVQTFTKDQYIEMVGLLIISKMIVGPAGMLYVNNTSIFNSKSKEYSLVSVVIPEESGLYETAPVKKLLDGFAIVVESQMKGFNADAIAFSKGVPKEEFPKYLFGITVLKLLPVSIPEYDNDSTNIVTFFYSTARKVLVENKSIYEKREGVDPETGDQEDYFSMYRMISPVTPGCIQEVIASVANVKNNLSVYMFDVEERLVDTLINRLAGLEPYPIFDPLLDLAVIILSITPERKHDPKAIGLVRYESIAYFNGYNPDKNFGDIVTLMVTASLVAYKMNHKSIAWLLMSAIDVHNMTISDNAGREHISKERRIELEQFYKIKPKLDANDEGEPVIINAINALCNDIISVPYRCLAGKELGHEESHLFIDPNFRNQVADLIIDLHKRRHNNV